MSAEGPSTDPGLLLAGPQNEAVTVLPFRGWVGRWLVRIGTAASPSAFDRTLRSCASCGERHLKDEKLLKSQKALCFQRT